MNLELHVTGTEHASIQPGEMDIYIHSAKGTNEGQIMRRLVKAAPDMLAALKVAEHALNHDEFPETVACIKEAIAKAEGT